MCVQYILYMCSYIVINYNVSSLNMCMYVCLYIYIYRERESLPMYLSIYLSLYIYIYICIHIYAHTYTHAFMCCLAWASRCPRSAFNISESSTIT